MSDFNKYSAEDFFNFESWRKFQELSESTMKRIKTDLDTLAKSMLETGKVSERSANQMIKAQQALSKLAKEAEKNVTITRNMNAEMSKQKDIFAQNAKAYSDAAKTQKELKSLQGNLEEIAKKITTAYSKLTNEVEKLHGKTKTLSDETKAAQGSFDAMKERVKMLKSEMKKLGDTETDLAKKDALKAEISDLTKKMKLFDLEMKEAEKQAAKLAQEEQKLGKEYSDLKGKLEDVLKEYNALNAKKDQGIELTQDEINKLDELDKEAKKLATDMKKISDAIEGNISEYKKLNNELNQIRKEYKDLAAKKAQNIQLTDEEAEKFKKLEQRGKELDKIIKDIDAELGQFQRNVGNYSDAISGFLGQFGQGGQMISEIFANIKSPAGLATLAITAAALAISQLWQEMEKTNKIAKESANITQLQGQELYKVAGAAEFLAQKFEVDTTRVIRALNAQMRLFGMSAEEATNTLALGMQFAGAESDDLLDAINEYSPNFKKLGLDGKDAMIVISKAVRNASFTIDKAGDIINNFGIELFTDDFLTRVNKVDQQTVKMLQNMKKEGKTGADMIAAVSQRILDLQQTNINKAEQLKTAVFTAVGEEGISDGFLRDLANINNAFEDSLKLMTEREKKQYELNKAQLDYNEAFAKFSSNFDQVAPAFERMLLSLKTGALEFIDTISNVFLTNIEKWERAISKGSWFTKIRDEQKKTLQEIREMKPEDAAKAVTEETKIATNAIETNRKELLKLKAELESLGETSTAKKVAAGSIAGAVGLVAPAYSAKAMNLTEKALGSDSDKRRKELEMEIANLNVAIDTSEGYVKSLQAEKDEIAKRSSLLERNAEQQQAYINSAYDLEIAKLQARLDKNNQNLQYMYDNTADYYTEQQKLIKENEELELKILEKRKQQEIKAAQASTTDAGLLANKIAKIRIESATKEVEIRKKTNEQINQINAEQLQKAEDDAKKRLELAYANAEKERQIAFETAQIKQQIAQKEFDINRSIAEQQLQMQEKEASKLGLFNFNKDKQIQESSKKRNEIINEDARLQKESLEQTQKAQELSIQKEIWALENKAATIEGLSASEVSLKMSLEDKLKATQEKNARELENIQVQANLKRVQNEAETTEKLKALDQQRRELIVNSLGGGLLDMYQNMEQKRIDSIEDENKKRREQIKLMIKMIGLQMILAKLANKDADVSQIAGGGVRSVLGALGSFKKGGYTDAPNTGIFNKDGEITGVTHKNEFVASEETTYHNPITSKIIRLFDVFQRTKNKNILSKIPQIPEFEKMSERSSKMISDVIVSPSAAKIDSSDMKSLAREIGAEIRSNMPVYDIQNTADLIILKQKQAQKEREIRIKKSINWFNTK